ncbi:uncharacterized protein BT62DRAFT_474989 [Guyanagaster necrorhizus]|uniref:Secreted protein n=1 Tax=Guyanagaster necrorhizus TaxID=856835 RepID=A0A9P7VKJ7_9AGAR|nr:uncharacterized protein BT62DRAFT_474989 [Guyanagaster necrorhizus MCA 3950]KAG7441599.1 hypothetical protein BT62DRAFT_474989 [Guyanagaster necrorhizus MCA 3950]
MFARCFPFVLVFAVLWLRVCGFDENAWFLDLQLRLCLDRRDTFVLLRTATLCLVSCTYSGPMFRCVCCVPLFKCSCSVTPYFFVPYARYSLVSRLRYLLFPAQPHKFLLRLLLVSYPPRNRSTSEVGYALEW